MSEQLQNRWTTGNEIRFIETLGAHAPQARATSSLTPEELLEKYIKAMQLRYNWNGLDKRKILEAAKRQLRMFQLTSKIMKRAGS